MPVLFLLHPLPWWNELEIISQIHIMPPNMLIILSPLLSAFQSLGTFLSPLGDCMSLRLLRVDYLPFIGNRLGSLWKTWLSDLSEKLLLEYSFYLPISCGLLHILSALSRRTFYNWYGTHNISTDHSRKFIIINPMPASGHCRNRIIRFLTRHLMMLETAKECRVQGRGRPCTQGLKNWLTEQSPISISCVKQID